MDDSHESKELVIHPISNPSGEVDIIFTNRDEACQSAKPSTSDSTSPHQSDTHTSQPAGRCKQNSVQFSNVTVYHFTREQGFCSIPDNGWCSLGMSQKHCSVSRYEINHHQLIQRLKRKRRRLSAETTTTTNSTSTVSARLRGRTSMPTVEEFYPTGDTCRVPLVNSPPQLSPQLTGDRSLSQVHHHHHAHIALSSAVQSTPPPPCLSPPSPRRVLANLDECLANTWANLPSDCLDTDSETSLDRMPTMKQQKRQRGKTRPEKIMPLHASARIRLLKESGVTHFDVSEREECIRIRANRTCVGCSCGPRWPCLPERCSCARDGVQCQVDRASFPCSCLPGCCQNPNGRNEFPVAQVRSHVKQTIDRENHLSTSNVEAPVAALTNHHTTDSSDITRPNATGHVQSDGDLHATLTCQALPPPSPQPVAPLGLLDTMATTPTATKEIDNAGTGGCHDNGDPTGNSTPSADAIPTIPMSDCLMASPSPIDSPGLLPTPSARVRTRAPARQSHWLSPSGIPLVFTWRQSPKRKLCPSGGASSSTPVTDSYSSSSSSSASSLDPSPEVNCHLFVRPSGPSRMTNSTPLMKASKVLKATSKPGTVVLPSPMLPSPLTLSSTTSKTEVDTGGAPMQSAIDNSTCPTKRKYTRESVNLRLHTAISLGRLSLRRRAIPRPPAITGCSTTPGARRHRRLAQLQPAEARGASLVELELGSAEEL